MRSKKGFTLIELLIVIIIVGILAAVSIPMMQSNILRARSTEAVAALGAIRTALRIVATENNGDYTAGGTITPGRVSARLAAFNATDLDGTYFSNACYRITVVNPGKFTVRARGSDSATPKAADVANITLFIDETGKIW